MLLNHIVTNTFFVGLVTIKKNFTFKVHFKRLESDIYEMRLFAYDTMKLVFRAAVSFAQANISFAPVLNSFLGIPDLEDLRILARDCHEAMADPNRALAQEPKLKSAVLQINVTAIALYNSSEVSEENIQNHVDVQLVSRIAVDGKTPLVVFEKPLKSAITVETTFNEEAV